MASEVQSRPFKGKSRTVLDSTCPVKVDEVSSICGAAAVTCTVSVVVPIFSGKLSSYCAPTASVRFDCKAVENPAAVTLTSYTPAGKLGAV